MVLNQKLWMVFLGACLLVGCESSSVRRAPIGDVSHPQAPTVEEHRQPSGEGVMNEPPISTGVTARQSVLDSLMTEGRSLLAQRQWQQTIAVAEQGLRIDRRFGGFYRLLAEAHAALGEQSQAERFARQAERLCVGRCEDEEALLRRLNVSP